MNFTKYSQNVVLVVVTLLISLVFWLGFYRNVPGKLGFPSTTLETVFANYDGPNYMVISKCGYQKSCIATHFSLPQPLEYYPAHLPGFPILIKYFSLYTSTPKAMLIASLIGSIFFTLVSFAFFQLFFEKNQSFYLSLVLMFFPARLLVLRVVGAPETWYIASTLLSIILFIKNKHLLAAIFASLALSFKSPGILLFVAYGICALTEYLQDRQISKVLKKYFIYSLVPLTAIVIFYGYYLQTGDFWAYFHSGDNIHLNPWPYLVFMSNHTWINTIWLEDVIYILLISYFGLSMLISKKAKPIIFIYPLIYLLATVFVAHRDISRYISPIYPFLFLAYEPLLSQRRSKVIFFLLVPAIILFAINFLIGNVAPIADWTPYL